MEMGCTIDTAAAVGELQEAGLDRQSALAIVGLVARSDSRLATKADIELLRQATKSDLELLRQATKSDLAATNSRIDSLRKDMETRFEAVDRRFSVLQWAIALVAALQVAMAAKLFGLV